MPVCRCESSLFTLIKTGLNSSKSWMSFGIGEIDIINPRDSIGLGSARALAGTSLRRTSIEIWKNTQISLRVPIAVGGAPTAAREGAHAPRKQEGKRNGVPHNRILWYLTKLERLRVCALTRFQTGERTGCGPLYSRCQPKME